MCNGRLLAVQGNRGMKLHCGVSGKKNYFRCTKSQQTLLDLTLFCCIQPLLRLLNRDLTVCMDVNKNLLFIRFVHFSLKEWMQSVETTLLGGTIRIVHALINMPLFLEFRCHGLIYHIVRWEASH